MRKNLLILFLLSFLCLPFLSLAQDQNQPFLNVPKLNIYFFRLEGCPHCAKEEAFLKKLEKDTPGLKVNSFEISKNKDNALLLKRIGEKFAVNTSLVPLTIIGRRFLTGFQSEQTTGLLIKNLVKECLNRQEGCKDIIKPLIENFENHHRERQNKIHQEIPEKIKVPFLGELSTKELSLPLLTIIIGTIDGFNPCSMWVLVLLIGFLLSMGERKRMAFLGGAFILASAVAYFIFMAAWLNFFLFLGYLFWIRLAVGFIALWAGYYNLKKYFSKKTDLCEVSGRVGEGKILEKMKTVAEKKKLIFAFFGIIVLAWMVNLIELLCSAGLPAVYTKVLTLNHLPMLHYYLYLLFYLFFYMLDDMIVFFVALFTFRRISLGLKYNRFSTLAGGILMLIIGLLMIFKPAWLMFG